MQRKSNIMPRTRQIELRTPARQTNNEVIKTVIRLKQDNPKMTAADIARSVGRDRSSVTRALKRYGMDTKRVTQYSAFKADILAGIQDKILISIDDDKIAKASLKDSAIAFGILDDKERLERGKATKIVELSDIVELIDKEERQKLVQVKPGEYSVS